MEVAVDTVRRTVGTHDVAQLASRLRGSVLRPGEQGYDEARVLWNGMVNKRPAVIAQCRGVADVIEAVNFARNSGLELSVRGGGHNVAGNALCDGGLTIDLTAMRSVRVDPKARTARAEGGATWGDFDKETQVFGLATTGGAVPTTGIAGLTLGGGIGWLMNKYGLACDNLLSADVVTADGQLLIANETENADLFWGLRGGGGNFGVATSLEYRVHPVGRVLAGLIVYPLAQAREVMRFFKTLTADAPDELVAMIVLMTSPEGQKLCAVAVCFNGDHDAGQRLLAPLRGFGRPIADQIASMPYIQMQNMFIEAFPYGHQNYWKSNFLNELAPGAIDVLIQGIVDAPSPMSSILIEQLGGAVLRADDHSTAFSHRTPTNFSALGVWKDAAENATHMAWVRDVWSKVQPFSSGGVYVNYLGEGADEGGDRIREAYGPEKYARLMALKQKYDPMNLFRGNQNINPHGLGSGEGSAVPS
jgi:FAD/FMN-containing dehydrogenase